LSVFRPGENFSESKEIDMRAYAPHRAILSENPKARLSSVADRTAHRCGIQFMDPMPPVGRENVSIAASKSEAQGLTKPHPHTDRVAGAMLVTWSVCPVAGAVGTPRRKWI
jgi:hypothetical protein